jgi:hypothetical protein
MKKILTVLIVTFIMVSSSFAQGFKFGPKLGANMGKIQGNKFSNQYALGYHVGAFAEINFGKKIGIQPEVLWNQINADTVTGFSNVYNVNTSKFENIQLRYLSIPILLNYRPVKMLTLQAGPQFGILINQNQNLVNNGKEAFKNGDLSMLFGAQVNILKLRLYGRYAIGLNDIGDLASSEKWTSQSIQLGVGFSF